MYKIKKFILLFFFSLCVFTFISSISAADFYVYECTTHKDITEWIDTKAKNGDNLIFNTVKYDLSDNLIINKSINIKSYKNTVINFNKSEGMIKAYADGKVVLSDLTLNHNSKHVPYMVRVSTISAGYMDIKNTVINTNFNWGSSIRIVKGNVLIVL
jgi:hypothetical protein